MKVIQGILMGLSIVTSAYSTTNGCTTSKHSSCYDIVLFDDKVDCRGPVGWTCAETPDGTCCGTDGRIAYSCWTDAPGATLIGGAFIASHPYDFCAVEVGRGKTCVSSEGGLMTGCKYTWKSKSRMDTKDEAASKGCVRPNFGWQIVDGKKYSISTNRTESETWAKMAKGPEKEAFIITHADNVEDVPKKRG